MSGKVTMFNNLSVVECDKLQKSGIKQIAGLREKFILVKLP